MASILESLSDMGNSALDLFKGEQNFQSNVLEVTKIACVVASIACAYLFALNPTALVFFKAGVSIGVFSEFYKVAGNWQQIFKNPALNLLTSASDNAFVEQLGKNTFLMGPILKLIYPHIG